MRVTWDQVLICLAYKLALLIVFLTLLILDCLIDSSSWESWIELIWLIDLRKKEDKGI
jgi:hypothetical protein